MPVDDGFREVFVGNDLGGQPMESEPRKFGQEDKWYIPMCRGFLYLFAVIDCFSRRVLA